MVRGFGPVFLLQEEVEVADLVEDNRVFDYPALVYLVQLFNRVFLLQVEAEDSL